MMCRFYYADGRCEMREVYPYPHEKHPPQIWKVPGKAPRMSLEDVIGFAARERAHAIARVHTFVLRRYWHREDFIGPHRDDDYHEEKS
ncbi:MAG TPA: hypothetical protein VGM39_08645 [Kofleriaceae bacterium]|jgi:hypothetical protein